MSESPKIIKALKQVVNPAAEDGVNSVEFRETPGTADQRIFITKEDAQTILATEPETVEIEPQIIEARLRMMHPRMIKREPKETARCR